MANDTKSTDESKSAQNYKVINGGVGSWDKGAVFSMEQFKKLHPLKDKKPDEVEEYHAALIDRLLALDVIEPTKEPAGAGPSGPHVWPSSEGILTGGIKASAQAARADKAARKQAVEGDVAQRSAKPAVESQASAAPQMAKPETK